MVILGSGGRDYPNLAAALEANRVDPLTATRDAYLVVYELHGGHAEIIAQGLKIRCDGGVLVLGLRRSEYDYGGGVLILGTGGREEDVEPGDRRTQSVRLAGRRVASGTAYQAWVHRRSGGR